MRPSEDPAAPRMLIDDMETAIRIARRDGPPPGVTGSDHTAHIRKLYERLEQARGRTRR